MGNARRTLLTALLLTFAAATARADDADDPVTTRADAVEAAIENGDEDALARLAASEAPDPWLVVDALCRRGAFAAATTFAGATPEMSSRALSAYVASEVQRQPDANGSTALASALAAGEATELDRHLAKHPPSVSLVQALQAHAAHRQADDPFGIHVWRSSAEAAERIGWLAAAFIGYLQVALATDRARDTTAQGHAFEATSALARRHGGQGLRLLDRVLSDLYIELRRDRRHEDAFVVAGQVAALRQDTRPEHVGVALESQALAAEDLGRLREAQALFEQAITAHEAHGHSQLSAVTRSRLAGVLDVLGETGRALELQSRALAEARALELDPDTIAELRMGLALLEYRLGRLDTARERLERLVAEARERGDKNRLMLCLANLATVLEAQNQIGTAISYLEEAEQIAIELGNDDAHVGILGSLADCLMSIGALDRAVRLYERTLAVHERRGEKADVAAAHIDMGTLYYEMRDADRALEHYEAGRLLAESIGHKLWLANAVSGIAGVHALLRADPARALPYLDQALALRNQIGDEFSVLIARLALGGAYANLGDPRGIPLVRETLARAREIGADGTIVRALIKLALNAALADDHEHAIEYAREALVRSARLNADLDEVSAARLNDKWQLAAGVATMSALELEDHETVAWMLEAGRSRELARALGGRDAVLELAVDAELRAAEQAARVAEARAAEAYRLVSARGNFKASRAALQQVKQAREEVERIVARIGREARRSAPRIDAPPPDLARIQASLRDDEVFLAIKSFDTFAIYLRLTRDDISTNWLFDWDQIEAFALKSVETGGREFPGIGMLGMKLTLDCRLGSHFKRILFSPDEVLAYVPPAVLFPGRSVTLVPSATVYTLLLEQAREPGEGVLAVGDVDYANGAGKVAGGTFLPLPATRAEALAVGTETLLAGDATETALVGRLRDPKRWRSLHLACHGILDAEEGTRSALLLGPDATNDGALTTLDIFRLEVRADLVVMSACETARGKVYSSEGVMGLTRAFMAAGVPRVICSLWKVDDAATKALMLKFYELWNPESGDGLGASEALRVAQLHVRRYETEVEDKAASEAEGRVVMKRVRPWSHPYYWAAWVLWGLPE